MQEYLKHILSIVKKQYPSCNVYFDSDNWINIDSNEVILIESLNTIVNTIKGNWEIVDSNYYKDTNRSRTSFYYFIKNKNLEADVRTYQLNKLLQSI